MVQAKQSKIAVVNYKAVSAASFLCSVHSIEQLSSLKFNQPQVAFVGRSNVGKSSLMNSMVSRRRLVISGRTPGVTRSINFFLVNESILFVDLPGYGFTKQKVNTWGAFIENYLGSNQFLKTVVMVIDARHNPQALDVQMYNWLISKRANIIVAANKADKLTASKLQHNINIFKKQWPSATIIPYSAVKHLGRNELWQNLEGNLAVD